MPEPETPEPRWRQLAWENRDKIIEIIAALYHWVWPPHSKDQAGKAGEENPGVLVLGPGGVGKSTFGRIMSGQFTPLFDDPGAYDESIDVETYEWDRESPTEISVPPGQSHRRDATWGEKLAKLAQGKFRGMILLSAYGYHNHEIGPMTSYKTHRLFRGNKEAFLEAFLQDRRNEELQILRELAPKVSPPASGKFWMLSLVTKQDLWWNDRADAESFYMSGDYAAEIAKHNEPAWAKTIPPRIGPLFSCNQQL